MHPQYTHEFHAYFDPRTEVHPQTGCWLWTLSCFSTGYGQAKYKRTTIKASRLAYLLAFGAIPNGLHVLHMCESLYPPGDQTHKLCCNPQHLKLGTHKENMADRDVSGHTARGNRSGARTRPDRRPRGDTHDSRLHPERRPRGATHWHARLTTAQVTTIRQLFDQGLATIPQLAIQFGVSYQAIWKIVHRKTWTNLP